MTWFQAFRGEFGYTYYGERRTPVTIDIPLAAVTYACILISIATIIAAAGIKGKERWYTLLRVVYGLAIGSFILVAIYGYCWQVGKTNVSSTYIFRSNARFDGSTGIKIGLRQINITLTGTFEGSENNVNYNEEIPLEGVRGPINELRNFLTRGLPDPVLSVVEFISIDQGGMRWGRSFHIAGYFAYILLWTAFSFWLLANFLLSCVVFYGAVLYTLTGVTMVIASTVYHILQPTHQLRLLYAEAGFHLTYGWCFWSISIFGALTIIIGLVVLLLEHKYPKKMAKLFLIETQFEIDNVEDSRKTSIFSISSNLSTPQVHQNIKRRGSSPNLWHLNKGFNFDEINKENPVFEETENEENQSESTKINIHSPHKIPGSPTRSHSAVDLRSSIVASEDPNKSINLFTESLAQSQEDRLKNVYITFDTSANIGQKL